ncbi:hypothetical protein CERSUDRAFT_78764, partial [Gelatoporia subvermispora B]
MGRKLKYIDKEARKAARAAQKRRLLDLARQPFVVTEWDGLEDLSLGLWNVPYECSAEHINFHQWGLILDQGNERRDRAEHSEEGFAALVAQIDQERGDRLRQWMKDFKRLASVTLDEELWRTGLGWSARILAVIESEAE